MLIERPLPTTPTELPAAISATRHPLSPLSILGRWLFLTYLISCLAVSSPAQTLTTLYSFQGGADGAGPNPDLAARPGDRYYGTTGAGGTNNFGTIFKLIPPGNRNRAWTKSVLYNFTGGKDGAFPFFTSLVFDQTGAAYGTTEAGGDFNFGVIFKLTPPANNGGQWTQRVLYSFSGGEDGAFPQAGVVFDRSGALYGTTANGGIVNSSCGGGCGAIFKLSPPPAPDGEWTEKTLYRFTGGVDGTFPGALVFGPAGALYGMTNLGGTHLVGVVYKLNFIRKTNVWTHTVLHSFETGNRFAGYPQSALIFDRSGALYGTRQTGGDLGFGIVFKLSPPASKLGDWTAQILHSFGSAGDGLSPIDRVTLDRTGAVYGTTGVGGNSGQGIIFRLNPPVGIDTWTETILHTFSGKEGLGSTTLRINYRGELFGTSGGGPSASGVFFRFTP